MNFQTFKACNTNEGTSTGAQFFAYAQTNQEVVFLPKHLFHATNDYMCFLHFICLNIDRLKCYYVHMLKCIMLLNVHMLKCIVLLKIFSTQFILYSQSLGLKKAL